MSLTPRSILPASGRPVLERDELESLIAPLQVDFDRHPLVVVGLRGFLAAHRGANQRNVYDDTLCLYAPSRGLCLAFNGNTEPSEQRLGSGTGTAKGTAVLNPGVWYAHRFAIHGGRQFQYEAICQRAAPVTVTRDGAPPYADHGMHGINIHRGGNYTTSSEGCQTVPPPQWDEFIGTATRTAQTLFGLDWRQCVVAYALVDCTDRNPFVSPVPAAPAAPRTLTPGRFLAEVIRPTLQALGYGSAAAEQLLLGTAIAESGLRERRQLGDGPARGLFQMEPKTHEDIWQNYLQYRPNLAAAVRRHTGGLPPSADLLEQHDDYACAMARVHYMRVSAALPPAGNLTAQAAYWKAHYNTQGGGGSDNHYLAAWSAAKVDLA
jgi:hypothetical protein